MQFRNDSSRKRTPLAYPLAVLSRLGALVGARIDSVYKATDNCSSEQLIPRFESIVVPMTGKYFSVDAEFLDANATVYCTIPYAFDFIFPSSANFLQQCTFICKVCNIPIQKKKVITRDLQRSTASTSTSGAANYNSAIRERYTTEVSDELLWEKKVIIPIETYNH